MCKPSFVSDSRKIAISVIEKDEEVYAAAIGIPSLKVVSTILPRGSIEEALNAIQGKAERRRHVSSRREEDCHPQERLMNMAYEEGQKVAEKIYQFCTGKNIQFSERLDLSDMTSFQRRVLLTTKSIPRGRVASYFWVAEKAGFPGAYRAVGNVMATNPFPPIVPCHRVVRSNGEVGNFGSGIHLKKKLLQLEEVAFEGDLIPTEFFSS